MFCPAYSSPPAPHLVGRASARRGRRLSSWPRSEHGSAPLPAQRMNGTFFDIGLGLGLATACGIRPYLPALLAGALGSSAALHVSFKGNYHFLQTGWWLLAVAAVLALTYIVQLRMGAERFDAAASGMVGAHALAVGALLFAGTL